MSAQILQALRTENRRQGRTPKPAPRVRLQVEALEDRIALTWGSRPPATIVPPSFAQNVELDALGDAIGGADIGYGEIDWYRFTAHARGRYVLEATTPYSNLNPILGLYTDAGRRVGYNDNISASNKDSRLSLTLNAGQTYFLGVTDRSGGPSIGAYAWRIDGPTRPIPPDDAYENNDTIAAATWLGTLATQQAWNGLRMSDAADFYRFSMPGQGAAGDFVAISFSHAQGDLDLRLYDASGFLVGSSAGVGNGEFISLAGLSAGTYFAHVYGAFGAFNPNYSLSIRPGTTAPDDFMEDNDSFAAAADLGTLQNQQTIYGLVMADAADCYRFTMSGAGTASDYVAISFWQAQGNLNLNLYNSFGQLVGSSAGFGDGEVVSLAGLAAGTYTVQVYGFLGAFNPSYNLTIDPGTAPLDDGLEENDSFASAYDLGLQTAPQIWYGLRMADAADWYRFTMTGAGTAADYVAINFLHSQGDLELRLYNAAGMMVGSSETAADVEFISLSGLSAGTYTIHVFGYLGAFNPNYTLSIDPGTGGGGGNDDWFEENDTIGTAADLGLLNGNHAYEGLQMNDAADWYRFSLGAAGGASDQVRISFINAYGDLDMKLYDGWGNLVGSSDSYTDSETISLSGLSIGTYYLHIYGWGGAHNPAYNLNIAATGGGGDGGGGGSGDHVLYLNFDGASISRSDLVRWAGGQWDPNSLDPEGNGIQVSAFLAGNWNREAIISQMISMIQADLNPYGITVRRHTGLAVEAQRATTLFLGQSELQHPHIACDIDYGNDNSTDIAFVGDEDWGSANSTAITMADVALHEAGHTFGLWHVASGSALESMGYRYNNDQSQWVQDTRFLDQTFQAYSSGGQSHGPGPLNTHRTMLAAFSGGGGGGGGGGNMSNVALTDSSGRGVFRVLGSEGADRVTVERIGRFDYRVSVNGGAHIVSGSGLREIQVFTNGDRQDEVVALNALGRLRLRVDRTVGGALRSQAKLDPSVADLWARNRHGGGCGCPTCSATAALASRSEAAPPTVDAGLAVGLLSGKAGRTEEAPGERRLPLRQAERPALGQMRHHQPRPVAMSMAEAMRPGSRNERTAPDELFASFEPRLAL